MLLAKSVHRARITASRSPVALRYQRVFRHRFGTKKISANTTANGPKKNPRQNDRQKRLPV
jgi:hypothetical protein